MDLSKSYLEWARKNMQANNFSGSNHEFVCEDTIKFLKSARSNDQQFDLCVVDPPTYSNSKQTEEDWDVQSRHVELLNLVGDILTPGGVVFFSTNFRRFKFGEGLLTGFESFREISKQTVPEDFRNQRIHRCWRLVKQSAGN